MTNYEVEPCCTVEDAKGIATCNATAFWTEAWWKLLWTDKSLDSVIEAIAARTPRNLLQMRGMRRHQKVIDKDTGDVVGYARWVLPDTHDEKWLEAQTPDVDEEMKKKFKDDFDNADYEPRDDTEDIDDHLWDWREKYDRDDCLELEYLAVHPDHRRKGVATLLVKSGLKMATELGLDIIVIAMGEAAQDVLLKQGFECLEKESQDLTPYGAEGTYKTYYLIKKAATEAKADA